MERYGMTTDTVNETQLSGTTNPADEIAIRVAIAKAVTAEEYGHKRWNWMNT